MKTAKIMDIGEVIKRSGLPASTLRYYEEKGLITSIGRKGLRRLYSSEVIERLALITLGRTTHFSLDEIGDIFTDIFTPAGPHIDRKKLLAKADELDENIQHLITLRDGLHHAANCPAPSHFECPTFLGFLRNAGKNPVRKRNKLTGFNAI